MCGPVLIATQEAMEMTVVQNGPSVRQLRLLVPDEPRMESTPIGDLVAAELAAARRREEDWARFGAACEARAEQARFDALQRALRRRRGLAAAGKLLLGLLILAATLASALSAVAAIR